MFHVGQKVVCVDARPGRRDGLPCPFSLGKIYTIYYLFSDGELLMICEAEGNWLQKRFRPLEEHKIDISALTALLNPVKQTEDA